MKIIFIKDQPGAGKKGEIKEVSSGFATNFLIPKGFAQVVTPQLEAKMQKESKEAEEKKIREAQKMSGLKQDLEKRVFTIKVKVGDKGQVFGGIHEKEIAKAITDKMGLDIDKNQIEISGAIKELGQHQIKLKLISNVFANIKINLEPLV